MRPIVDESAVDLVRQAVPEFEGHYLDLLDIYDEDLTPEIVFMELADYVAQLLATGNYDDVLGRCFGVVEDVAMDGDDGRQLVALSFLNELSESVLALADPFMGRATADLADDDSAS